MSAIRVLGAVAGSAFIALFLSSCVLLPSIVNEATQHGPVNDRPAADGPEGWTEFPSCEGGPRDDFIWVDGIPSAELDAAGIGPDCGDTWIEEDGDSFMNVTDYSLTEEQLDALGDALIASGWEKKYDDFVPATATTGQVGVGARDYYTSNDDVKFAIEIYNNGTDPVSYTAYLDYHSPSTRALQ